MAALPPDPLSLRRLGASPPHPRLGHLFCRILGSPLEKPMKFCPPPRNFGPTTPLPILHAFYAFEQHDSCTTTFLRSITFSAYLCSECRLHLSLHGCKQAKETIGDKYATETGYLETAVANNFIILFPQVKKDLINNPNGCFDW